MILFFLFNFSFSTNLFFQWRITDKEKAQLKQEALSLFNSNYELYQKMISNFRTRDLRYKYYTEQNEDSSDEEKNLYISRYTYCQKCINFIKSLRQIRDKYSLQTLYDNLKKVVCPLLKSKLDPEACVGFVNNYGNIIMENIFSRYVDSYYLCEKIDLCPIEIPKKFINIENYAKNILKEKDNIPISQKEKIDENGTKLRMLQVTDIHLDLEYKEGAKVSCLFPICCRDLPTESEKENIKELSGKYGYEGKCDINENLVKSFVDDASKREVDFIIWTGDNAPHDSWTTVGQESVYKISKKIRDIINEKFRNDEKKIPIYYSLGNHERYPNDAFRDNEKEMLESMGEIFKDYLSDEAYEDFRNYGYYSIKYKDSNLRIISINCLVCDAFNFNLLNSTKIHVKRMFEWLEEELKKAEKNKEFVFIINHFPLNGEFTLTECGKRFHALFDRYQYIVRGIFSGHTHLDDIEVINEYYNKDKIIHINYIAPQLTTYSNKLPSYRIYIIDEETKQVLDYEQYRFDMDRSNAEGKPYWNLAYKATEFFGVKNMLEYEKIINFDRMEDYIFNRYSGSKEGEKNKKNSEALKNARCAMTTNNFDEYMDCINIKFGLDFELITVLTNYLIGPFEE